MIRRRRRFLAAGLLVVVLLAAYTTTRAQDSGYRYPSPPLIGAWEQVLIGTFQPFPEDQLVTKTYWGLHHTETWLDFYLRNDSGKYYLTSNALQSSADGSQLTANPWLERGLQSSANGMVVDPRTKQWTGTASQELTAEAKVKYTATNGARAETISFDDKTAEWKSENGDIDLKGTLVSPGINWLLPYREQSGETDEIYYAAQSYKVDGTYHGEPVKGYVQIEHFFGTTTYRDSWWWRNRLGNWVYWNNEYANGSQEYGQFLCGEYGARGAAIANDKGEQVLNTREINATAGEGGNINYEIAKHGRFEYIDDPTGRLPKTSATGSYGTGLVRRVGEQREIVRHNAVSLVAGQLCEPLPTAGACSDSAAPLSRFLRKKSRIGRNGLRLRGRARDRGCGGTKRVQLSVARKVGKRCAFLRRNSSFTKARSCSKATYLKTRGKRRWRLRKRVELPAGTYVIRVRAVDKAGNRERRTRKRNVLIRRVS